MKVQKATHQVIPGCGTLDMARTLLERGPVSRELALRQRLGCAALCRLKGIDATEVQIPGNVDANPAALIAIQGRWDVDGVIKNSGDGLLRSVAGVVKTDAAFVVVSTTLTT